MFKYNPPVERMGEFSKITSRFGPRSGSFHWGLDIAPLSRHDGLVRFISTGTVLRSAWHDASGNFIEYAADIWDGRKVKVLYAHLAEPAPLKKNDKFDVGQWAGIIGSTGNSTGKHVHIEITDDLGIKRDPEIYLENLRLVSEAKARGY